MDDFLEFLGTAAVKGLRVGSSEADVLAVLGPPDATSAIKPPIWKYGQTEITFREGRTVMIAMGAEPHPDLTYDEQIAFVIVSSGVTLTLDLERPLARAYAS